MTTISRVGFELVFGGYSAIKHFREKKMGLGLIGKKVGMTQIFSSGGDVVAVTVVYVPSNKVLSVEKRGQDRWATRLAFKELAKSPKSSGDYSCWFFGRGEVPVGEGAEVGVDSLPEGGVFDVMGTSQGKGFTGTIKRYGFNSGRASHGNSRAHNVPGSIGMAQDPGRVFPGKRMSGRMGGERVVVQGLELLKVDPKHNVLMLKGATPGHKGAFLVLKPAVKPRRLATSVVEKGTK